VLGTLKLQYPYRTLRQVNYYEQHIEDREDDEREVYDFPVQVRQTGGEQYATRKENAVQRQQYLLVRRVTDF